MKTPPSRRASGFTLVELLIVIVIIAVLVSLGVPAGLRAIQNAKKTTALAAANGVETAVEAFYNEYGTMPVDGLSADSNPPIQSDDQELLNVLLGREDADPPLNTRAIKYLNVPEGKRKGSGGTDGLVFNDSQEVVGLYDPWGGLFYIVLDGDYDEKIVVQPAAAAGPKTLNGRRVAVWSNGADGVNGGGEQGDDVKTWK